jgi:hypothetical protein
VAGRIRSIKPEWIEDEEFNACSDAAIRMAKVFYALVDDEGRCKASVRALGLAGWKFCDRIVDKTAHARAALDELIDAEWLIAYEVSGHEYWQIRNFAKHQKISKFTESKLPPPPEKSPALRTAPDSSGGLQSAPEDSGKLRPDMDLEGIGSGGGESARGAQEPATSELICRAYGELWGQAYAAPWPPGQARPEQLKPMAQWFETTAQRHGMTVAEAVDRVLRNWSRDDWARKKRYPWASFAKQYADHWLTVEAANDSASNEPEHGEVQSW